MEIIGYLSFVVMGIVLGLIGGGGSILTVPILVYIMGIDAVQATSYSLFIVGIAAAFGSVQFMRNKLVDLKAALVFSIPSLIAVFITRLYIMPALPSELFQVSEFIVTKSIAVLLLFSVLMLAASFSMIKSKSIKSESEMSEKSFNYPMIFIEGFIVGILTGLVGAGGGFLIIPALVLLAKIPMKIAVGTSLVIIAVKSIIGFTGDILSSSEINWLLLTQLSVIAIFGMYLGTYLAKKISGEALKKGFGIFVFIMGIFIIVKELFL